MSRERPTDRGLRSRRIVVGAVAALVGVAVVAIGLVVLRPGAAPLAPANGAASTGPVSVGTGVGQRAPDFKLVEVGGETITRDTVKGKPALIWFTAAYCTPCQEGALLLRPILEAMGPDRIRIVMVFIDPTEPPAALVDWRQRFGQAEWDVALDGGRMTRDFGVQYLDTKYLLDRDGNIQYTDIVKLDPKVWGPAIEKVVGGS